MDETEFEGTLILEKLAQDDLVDVFFEAIDSDNFAKVRSLLENADIDPESISMVLKKMSDTDDNL